MIITRKAAVGFLLLAAIVFPVVYYATPTPGQVFQQSSAAGINLSLEDRVNVSGQKIAVHYHPPAVLFKSKWEAALVITCIMEVFALVCYIALKKLEPVINNAAISSMRYLKEQVENIPKEE